MDREEVWEYINSIESEHNRKYTKHETYWTYFIKLFAFCNERVKFTL